MAKPPDAHGARRRSQHEAAGSDLQVHGNGRSDLQRANRQDSLRHLDARSSTDRASAPTQPPERSTHTYADRGIRPSARLRGRRLEDDRRPPAQGRRQVRLQRAVMFKDDSGHWVTRSYDEVGDTVKKLALGLIGARRSRRATRSRSSATPGPSGPTSTSRRSRPARPSSRSTRRTRAEECEYVLENSDAKVGDRRGRGAAREDPGDPRPLPEARARDPHDRHGRRRDLRSTS